MAEGAEPSPKPAPAASGRVAMALKPGQTVLEYSIEQTLGGGGFGITYLARDVNLNLPVALKEYLPAELAHRAPDGSVAALADSTADQFKWGLERFLDEARALATFRHPNIARVLRYFVAHGTAYIVMEYETGRPLKNWLPAHSPIDRNGLLRIAMPVLDGLEMIHNAGFLHRDVKPDNIYVRADGSPVLIDFGSARNLSSGRDLTTIVSPGFAPFEQYHSRGHQGPWSDLYSLAAVMYWMVTGQKPIEAASRLKNDAMVPAAKAGRADLVGLPILEAIDWALDPEETKRPQSVAEFRARIAPGSASATTRVAEAGAAPPPSPDLSPSSASGGTTSAPRGNMVCTVLFLDIVGYSKVSVNEQYEIKSRFNQLIAGKLAHIAESSRITLDTGDGAAICFMGDPEEVLHTAVDIRRSISPQDKMRVRIGLHMGPVRILNDLNGRVNVIGDGINAAQRVMSFADENALLVSRAFYDVVSCLSDGAERAFRHIGAQADKHGRMHELYEVVPEDKEGAIGNRTLRIDGERILPLGAGEAPGGPGAARPASTTPLPEIDPAELAVIERDLARHLGPLAPVLMRKARGRADTPAMLRDLLALSISDPVLREAFRTGQNTDLGNSGRRSSREDSSRLSDSRAGNSSGSPSQPSGGGSTTSVSTLTTSQSQSAASVRPWLPQERLTALEKLLAQTMGPVARVLVKTEVRKAMDYASLCKALAQHIEDAKARTQFSKDAAQLP